MATSITQGIIANLNATKKTVDIYIRERNGSREIRVPWLPEKIDYASGGITKITYDIMGKGPVDVPTGTGLSEWTWKSIFPGASRTDDSLLRGEKEEPYKYHNILEEWRLKGTPLILLVVGYPINADVHLEDYNGICAGGFRDIEYEVTFVEDRDVIISCTTPQEKATPTDTERPATKTTSYTVVKGDNLWKIAQNKLGKGSRNKEIYELNKDIIESTAKKYGKKSSNNGWWIYPGTKLSLPAA